MNQPINCLIFCIVGLVVKLAVAMSLTSVIDQLRLAPDSISGRCNIIFYLFVTPFVFLLIFLVSVMSFCTFSCLQQGHVARLPFFYRVQSHCCLSSVMFSSFSGIIKRGRRAHRHSPATRLRVLPPLFFVTSPPSHNAVAMSTAIAT
jgi:hypothetical protein